MLELLKNEANMTYTENGAVTYESSLSDCLDLFFAIGAVRYNPKGDIISRFKKAYAENPDLALKILFFGRDIRGGIGERRVFRVIIKWLANNEPEALRKNLAYIPEYGRFDDLLALLDTACEKDALELIRRQLVNDLSAEDNVSLLAKWLPSVNASNKGTVLAGKKIARYLGMTDKEYRKTLAALRKKIRIIENNLRERDYTFDYSAQPSKAMLKYRSAFFRNDGDRYIEYLESVEKGSATMHTATLMPYDIIRSCLPMTAMGENITEEDRKALDVTWNALEDFGSAENAIVVMDGSGSMYCCGGSPSPITVAMSLAIYFAERNKGKFKNHFITFSENPQLVEIKGRDIVEKVRYCVGYHEVANTDLQRVFELILKTAVKNKLPQSEMPDRIYIVSDMEFDCCMDNAEETNYEHAKRLFESHGYKLPQVVFWNVASRHRNQPVTMNEQGTALVSGCNPRLFSMIASGEISPYKAMLEIANSERYAKIVA